MDPRTSVPPGSGVLHPELTCDDLREEIDALKDRATRWVLNTHDTLRLGRLLQTLEEREKDGNCEAKEEV